MDRSTLAYANEKRTYKVFEDLYYCLKKHLFNSPLQGIDAEFNKTGSSCIVVGEEPFRQIKSLIEIGPGRFGKGISIAEQNSNTWSAPCLQGLIKFFKAQAPRRSI